MIRRLILRWLLGDGVIDLRGAKYVSVIGAGRVTVIKSEIDTIQNSYVRSQTQDGPSYAVTLDVIEEDRDHWSYRLDDGSGCGSSYRTCEAAQAAAEAALARAHV